MQIADNRVVTLAYTLKDNDDNIIDKSDDGSFCYLHGARNIIPGLENALTGKTTGEELSVSIPPEEAYGLRDEARQQEVQHRVGAQLPLADEGHRLVALLAAVPGHDGKVGLERRALCHAQQGAHA